MTESKVTVNFEAPDYPNRVTKDLHRYYGNHDLHFITCSKYFPHLSRAKMMPPPKIGRKSRGWIAYRVTTADAWRHEGQSKSRLQMARLVSKLTVTAVTVIAFLAVSPSYAQNYGAELTRQWQQILDISKSEGKYQWFGYPVDNFGVLTSYAPPTKRHLTDSDRICATWSCVGVDPAHIPTDVLNYTTVNGFADSGQGPQLNLTNSKQSKEAVSLLLSNLLSALTINAGVNLSKQATVTLTADGVYKRSVNHDKFAKYIKTAPDSELKAVFAQGTLAYIGADIVAHNLKVNLSLDVEKDASVNVQLMQAIGALGKGSNVGLTLSSGGKGQYVLAYPGFVVLATQMHQQWKPGNLLTSTQGAEQAKQQFMAATSNVPKPEIDPATLKVMQKSKSVGM
jgi:hypothetical protein